MRRKNKKKNLPKRKNPVATETPSKPSITYKGSRARIKVVIGTITVAGILFFWSIEYFNPSNLQRFTNISLVILTAIAALRDLRDSEKKITKWGWVFSIWSVFTVVAFSMQTISPQEFVFKNITQGGEKITYLPGRTDTVYRTNGSSRPETNQPVLEILGPAEYSETDSTGHFKVKITVIDNVPARINSASSVLFTPSMIKGKLEAKGFRAHALDNTIVTKELPTLFTQNANKNGSATDTVYSYLKIGYTDRNKTLREEKFTRLYICAKNSGGTYDVIYRARAEDVKAMEYLKSQKLD